MSLSAYFSAFAGDLYKNSGFTNFSVHAACKDTQEAFSEDTLDKEIIANLLKSVAASNSVYLVGTSITGLYDIIYEVVRQPQLKDQWNTLDISTLSLLKFIHECALQATPEIRFDISRLVLLICLDSTDAESLFIIHSEVLLQAIRTLCFIYVTATTKEVETVSRAGLVQIIGNLLHHALAKKSVEREDNNAETRVALFENDVSTVFSALCHLSMSSLPNRSDAEIIRSQSFGLVVLQVFFDIGGEEFCRHEKFSKLLRAEFCELISNGFYASNVDILRNVLELLLAYSRFGDASSFENIAKLWKNGFSALIDEKIEFSEEHDALIMDAFAKLCTHYSTVANIFSVGIESFTFIMKTIESLAQYEDEDNVVLRVLLSICRSMENWPVEELKSVFPVVWGSVLSIFSLEIENAEKKSVVSECIVGYTCGLEICYKLSLQIEHTAFINSLVLFSRPDEVFSSKNAQCANSLIDLCVNKPHLMKQYWCEVIGVFAEIESTTDACMDIDLVFSCGQFDEQMCLLLVKGLCAVYYNNANYDKLLIVLRERISVEFYRSLYSLSRSVLFHGAVTVNSDPEYTEEYCEKLGKHSVDVMFELLIVSLKNSSLSREAYEEMYLDDIKAALLENKSSNVRRHVIRRMTELLTLHCEELSYSWESIYAMCLQCCMDKSEELVAESCAILQLCVTEDSLNSSHLKYILECVKAIVMNEFKQSSLQCLTVCKKVMRLCSIESEEWREMIVLYREVARTHNDVNVRNRAISEIFHALESQMSEWAVSAFEYVMREFVQSLLNDFACTDDQMVIVYSSFFRSATDLFIRFYNMKNYEIECFDEWIKFIGTKSVQCEDSMCKVGIDCAAALVEQCGRNFSESQMFQFVEMLKNVLLNTLPTELYAASSPETEVSMDVVFNKCAIHHSVLNLVIQLVRGFSDVLSENCVDVLLKVLSESMDFAMKFNANSDLRASLLESGKFNEPSQPELYYQEQHVAESYLEILAKCDVAVDRLSLLQHVVDRFIDEPVNQQNDQQSRENLVCTIVDKTSTALNEAQRRWMYPHIVKLVRAESSVVRELVSDLLLKY